MAAHRYWRIYVTAVQSGGYVSMCELEMYVGSEMTNVCSGGTAINSSTGFGWVAANAFDGSVAEPGWHSGTGNLPTTPEWVGYDFGAGNAKDITQVKMVMRNGNGGQAPKDFALQYSDDGSSWSTLWSVTGRTDWSTFFGTMCFDSGGRSDPPPTGAGSTSKQIWRIKATAVDGDGLFGVAEIEMRLTPGGADQCNGGTPRASSLSAGSIAAAFNNNTSDFWASGSALPDWIGYDFGSAKDIAEVVVTARGLTPAQSPKDFTVEYWDVNHWTTAHTYTGQAGWSGGETRTFTFGSATTRRPVVFACT